MIDCNQIRPYQIASSVNAQGVNKSIYIKKRCIKKVHRNDVDSCLSKLRKESTSECDQCFAQVKGQNVATRLHM